MNSNKNNNEIMTENSPLIILSNNNITTSSTGCLPARYVFGIMAMMGVTVAYIMRACLSIAITEMVISPIRSKNDHQQQLTICPVIDAVTNNTTNSSMLRSTGEFEWSEQTQGIILSSFYYGYIITHLPGGLLAQKFGGKHTFGLGILSTAIFTFLTPWAAGKGAFSLIILRFLEGLGEGTTFPAICTMLSQWAPPHERSILSTVIFTGVQIGTVLANLLGGIILQYVVGGWRTMFYIFGGISVVWFFLWCLLCYNDPSSHPFISEKEKIYLQKTIGETERKKDLGPLPWSNILSSTPVWALIIAEIGHDWGLYTMVTDLPKYMSDVMRFSVAQNGLLSSLPYLSTWIVSLTSSAVADCLLLRNYVSRTTIRKAFATFGSVGPAIGVICASYVGCDRWAAASLFIIGMGLMGFCYGSLRVNALDLTTNYSGTIMAFVNGLGCISGMLTPVVTGFFTPHSSLEEWRTVFWIMVVMLVSTNFAFLFFGSGEQQPWNDPKQDTTSIPICNNVNNDNGKAKLQGKSNYILNNCSN